jgi:hypothetical protein
MQKNTLTQPLYPAQQLGVLAENEVDGRKTIAYQRWICTP